MIRYADALNNLDAAIDAVSPTWRTRAANRTAIYQALGEYTEEWLNPTTGEMESLKPFWGDIKSVYMARQFRKCVYCEKRLEGDFFASVEWDLEHFRPKGRIRAWKPKRGIPHTTQYNFPVGGASAMGYYLLAYHPLNYVASCKTCNSTFKSDYFPVDADRSFTHLLPDDYDAEVPYLPYPLGNRGESPESLIGFVGVNAVPRHAEAQDLARFRRGCVMIDFFGLNRDGLMKERAFWLLNAVWRAVESADTGNANAVTKRDNLRAEKYPFANCVRCFLDLCRDNRPTAEAMLPTFEEIIAMDV